MVFGSGACACVFGAATSRTVKAAIAIDMVGVDFITSSLPRRINRRHVAKRGSSARASGANTM